MEEATTKSRECGIELKCCFIPDHWYDKGYRCTKHCVIAQNEPIHVSLLSLIESLFQAIAELKVLEYYDETFPVLAVALEDLAEDVMRQPDIKRLLKQAQNQLYSDKFDGENDEF